MLATDLFGYGGTSNPADPQAYNSPTIKEEWISRVRRDGFTEPLNWYKAQVPNYHYEAEKDTKEDTTIHSPSPLHRSKYRPSLFNPDYLHRTKSRCITWFESRRGGKWTLANAWGARTDGTHHGEMVRWERGSHLKKLKPRTWIQVSWNVAAVKSVHLKLIVNWPQTTFSKPPKITIQVQS